MQRIQLKNLIQQAVSKKEVRIENLARQKEKIDGPMKSASSHELSDLESEIEQEQKILAQYKLILEDVERHTLNNIVSIGSIVKVIFFDNNRKQTFFISRGTGNIDGIKIISLKSPIGKALLKSKVGEELTIDAPLKTVKLRIESIS